MPTLLIAVGEEGLGRKYPLGDRCVIGRHPDCDIQLIDSQVSKQHACLTRKGKITHIEDLDSRNGVYVNGTRIEAATRLVPNDVFTLGSRSFLFDPSLDVLPVADADRAVILMDDGDTLPPSSVARPLPAAGPAPDGFVAEALALLAGEAEPPLAGIMQRLGKRIPFDGAAVLRAEGARLRDAAYVRTRRRTLSVSRSIAEAALSRGSGVRIPDAVGDTAFRDGKSVIDQKLRSVLAAPLQLGRRAVGVVFLTRNQPDQYTDEHLALLLQVVPLLAVALAHTSRIDRLQEQLDRRAEATSDPGDIIGQSPVLEQVRQTIDKVAPAQAPALITGETGTGKELVARRLHLLGPGRTRPFVAVNCGALPHGLVESELFGHEKGAFTGAELRKPGKLELASGGTLFLDEIGDLPLVMQVKLLRALEQKNFYRVGGVQSIEVDFRLVAATGRVLEDMCRQGTFREDLFFRINVLRVEVPPLRERQEDVQPLARHFIETFNRELGKDIQGIDREAMQMLRRYPWPGNVRELRNVLERSAVLCEGPVITAGHLPAELLGAGAGPSGRLDTDGGPGTLAHQVEILERRMIADALRRARGKKVTAARRLGISRPTLDKKIAQYGIDIFKE